ncbi:hypothetical protein Ciccas_003804 [Cichlidogyrus casuarinus]|uniref:V-SNARE coiled-coil homology domain-containing protein n=1 Tax=Cichlidogyrus casuarinus TaxID=1844966 RepID=A0ABD2QDC2_9PLAT
MSLLYTAIANSRYVLVEDKKDYRDFSADIEQYVQRSSAIDQESNFHMHAENTQLTQLRHQANEVIVIAGQNVEQLFERQTRLEDLDRKADNLKNEAQMFERTTGQVSRHYWWANMRMKLIIGGVVFVILFIILMIILWQTGVFNKKESGTQTTNPPQN